MAKSNIALNLKKQQGDFQRYYDHFMRIFQELLITQFEYLDLPDTIDTRYLEMCLLGKGSKVAIFKDTAIDSLIGLPCTGLDIGFYQQPIRYNAYSVTGYNHEVYFNILDLKNSDGVVIYDNPLHNNMTYNTMDLYARRMANLSVIIDNHVRLSNTVPLILSSQDELLQAKNLMSGFDNNTPAIFVDRTFDPQDVKVLEFNKNFIGDKLYELVKNTWDDALKYLGIIRDFHSTKLERTIQAEVSQANSESYEIAYNRFYERQKGINYINKVFGLDAQVRFRILWTNNQNITYNQGLDVNEDHIEEGQAGSHTDTTLQTRSYQSTK